jgi:Glutathionylspermidine synthase preATP-grasp
MGFWKTVREKGEIHARSIPSGTNRRALRDRAGNLRPSGIDSYSINQSMMPIHFTGDPRGAAGMAGFILPAFQAISLGIIVLVVIIKPLLGREGANISITESGRTIADTAGSYAESGFIYQAYARPGCFDGHYVNIGAWMVADSCYGMGVREDRSPVISNQGRFVPHFFE